MRILDELPTFTRIYNALRSQKRSLTKDAINIYIFQGISLIVALVTSIFTSRTLGPSGKGLTNLFTLLTSLIIEFSLLGVHSGLVYYLSNKRKPLAEIHASVIIYSVIASMIIILTGSSFISPWKRIFSGLPEHLILLGFFMLPFVFYNRFWANLMTGVNLAPKVYKIQLIYAILTLIGIALLWIFNHLTPYNAVYLTAAVYILSAIINFLILGKINRFRLAISPSVLTESLKHGLKIYPGHIANWFHFRIDQIMINWSVGLTGVGLYSQSVRWAEMLWLMGFGIMHACFYKISASDKKSSYYLTKKLFKILMIYSSVAGLILALISKQLFALLYGRQFDASVPPLIILIPGVIAWDCARILSQYISFNRGKPHLCTIAAFFGMFVNIAGNTVAIPRWGINGAAIASSLSYTLVFIITYFYFKRLEPNEKR